MGFSLGARLSLPSCGRKVASTNSTPTLQLHCPDHHHRAKPPTPSRFLQQRRLSPLPTTQFIYAITELRDHTSIPRNALRRRSPSLPGCTSVPPQPCRIDLRSRTTVRPPPQTEAHEAIPTFFTLVTIPPRRQQALLLRPPQASPPLARHPRHTWAVPL